MKEIRIPKARYLREIMSITRRNEQVVHIITRCGEDDLVHMPKTMYDKQVEMRDELIKKENIQ